MKEMFNRLPTIDELAERGKGTTVTMSLRVKESTRAFFEEQARRVQGSMAGEGEEKRMTASALINSLLDSYAESYAFLKQDVQERRVIEKMRRSLENMVGVIRRADDDTLLRRVMQDPGSEDLRDNLMDMSDIYSMPEDACADFALAKRGKAADGARALRYLFDNADMIACNVGLAGSKGARCVEEDQWKTVALRPDKWIVVVAMTDCFVRKLHRWCPDLEASLGLSMMQKLAELAAETDDREELAKKLAEFYTDYTEQLNG